MNLLSGKSPCYKLMVYLCVASVIFMGIISFVSFRIEIDYANNKTEVMINQLIDTVENTATQAIASNDARIAKEVLADLLRSDMVDKAIITSKRGLFLDQKKGLKAGNQKQIVRELFSPFGDKKSIGQLSVIPSADFSLKEAKHTATSNVINAGILIGLILLTTLLLVYLLFSKPLIVIADTLRNIITGDQERIDTLQNNKNDELGRIVVNINKILDLLTTKLSTQRVLRKSVESMEKKLRNIFQSTSAGLFLLDKKGNVLTCTPTLLKIMDYQDANLTAINGQNFAELFFKEPVQFQQMMQNALEQEQLEAEDLMLRKNTDINPLWVHCLLSKAVYEDGITRFEGVVFDISKRVASEKAVQYEASHDTLTGLLRRNAAETQLKKHLATANSASTIVLLLDLDGFKEVNDTYGHDIGDIVLIEAAKHLEACVRHNDIVCRLGGDEFLIILLDCDSINTGFKIAKEIVALLSLPISPKDEIIVNVGVSIGIALFPMHGTTIEDLLKSADEAMYEVKRQGKNGYGIKGKTGTISVNRPLTQKRNQR